MTRTKWKRNIAQRRRSAVDYGNSSSERFIKDLEAASRIADEFLRSANFCPVDRVRDLDTHGLAEFADGVGP